MTTQSPFLMAGAACKELGMNNSRSIQKLYDLLPHMFMPKRQTRYFVAAYIAAYKAWLSQNALRANRASAAGFARTEEARQVIRTAVGEVERAFAAQAFLTRRDIIVFLGVGNMSVSDWTSARIITPHMRMAKVGRGRRLIAYYASKELRGLLEWRVPTLLRGN